MVRLITYKCDLCANIIKQKFKRLHFKIQAFSTTVTRDEFASGYVPNIVEKDKYDQWEKQIVDLPLNNNKKFSMLMPPPNITGTLHLGHALTLTIQDVLMRWHRMNGIPTIWVPGLDHAGIATQVVVERKLWQEKRQTRHDIGRDTFNKHVLLWKQEKSDKIKEQIKNLGALPNWNREYFTMDNKQAKAVNEAFIRLFDSGLIYRSDYLVNWSCILRSAISDIEVEHFNIDGRTKVSVPGYENPIEFGVLTKFAYKLFGEDGEVIVSTTRPETILGDVAIAVHPDDDRYTFLKDKKVIHPFRNEPIPIIFDNFVDPTFGTGAVKITPAHDPTDFLVGQRHNLPIRQIIDEQGIIIDKNKQFKGLKRFEAREIILKKLNAMGLLRSVENHSMTIPLCSRSKDVIEHLVKPQWFINCSNLAAEPAKYVQSGQLKIQPDIFEKNWFQWLDNIRDWCISRQLWWGHRIPAYRCTLAHNNVWVAAPDSDSARIKAASKMKIEKQNEIDNIEVVQDEDVLDTWFSSALLPFSVFGWPEQTQDLNTLYPTNLLETGHDILFFWVARMVMLGHALTGKTPFKKILLHGVICDAHGRKMSKSLGNVISPEHVIHGVTLQQLEDETRASHAAGFLSSSELDKALVGQRKMFPQGIPQCGADALRFTLLSHNIQSHFINFDISECYTNKLFCNKIWQAVKYTKMCYDKNTNIKSVKNLTLIDKWILIRLSKMLNQVNNGLINHEFHIATSALKQFLYTEFCDVFVETTKAAFKSEISKDIAAGHTYVLMKCLDIALRALAPFMPHLTDELYKYLPLCSDIPRYESANFAQFPQNLNYDDKNLENEVEIILDTVTVIRRLKKLANISAKKQPKVCVVTSSEIYPKFNDIISTLSGCKDVSLTLNETSISNVKTISDTVENHAIIHLILQDTTTSSDNNQYMLKKIDKIINDIRKMENIINADGYKNKAPENVQIQHNKKLVNLREELQRLQKLQQ